jgi:hypothetical protein
MNIVIFKRQLEFLESGKQIADEPSHLKSWGVLSLGETDMVIEEVEND